MLQQPVRHPAGSSAQPEPHLHPPEQELWAAQPPAPVRSSPYVCFADRCTFVGVVWIALTKWCACFQRAEQKPDSLRGGLDVPRNGRSSLPEAAEERSQTPEGRSVLRAQQRGGPVSDSPFVKSWQSVVGGSHGAYRACREMDHNNLTEVSKGWLYGLQSLQQLHLGYNSISRIQPDIWECCQKLSKLWVQVLPPQSPRKPNTSTVSHSFSRLFKNLHISVRCPSLVSGSWLDFLCCVCLQLSVYRARSVFSLKDWFWCVCVCVFFCLPCFYHMNLRVNRAACGPRTCPDIRFLLIWVYFTENNGMLSVVCFLLFGINAKRLVIVFTP